MTDGFRQAIRADSSQAQFLATPLSGKAAALFRPAPPSRPA